MMEAVDAIPVARKQKLLIIEQESALDSAAHISSGNFHLNGMGHGHIGYMMPKET